MTTCVASSSATEKSDLISRIKEFNVDATSWVIQKRAELGQHMAPVASIRGYGDKAITSSFDGTSQIYDLSSLPAPSSTSSPHPAQIMPIAHYTHSTTSTYAINNAAYDGHLLFTGGNDGDIHVSDVGSLSMEFGNLPSPRKVRVLKGHSHWIWCVEKPKMEHPVVVSGSVDQ